MIAPSDKLLYCFDAGNGTCKGVSSQRSEMIRFEPTLAPLTERRGLKAADEKPTYSLCVGEQTLVFGVEDVFAHGKRTAIRRLNSQERYTSEDYFHLLDVLYLHAFGAYRNHGEPITPIGMISVPVNVYNDEDTLNAIRGQLCGTREITDGDGCVLLLDIRPRRLLIVPESYGALMHFAYDALSFKKRSEANTTGTTLVVDIGYETTDLSLFEGLKFQRDRAESIFRAGMGILARAVQEYADKTLRSTDVSRIDRALREVAGLAPGVPKIIQPSPGVYADVTAVYDAELDNLAARIAQETLTRFPEAISRVLLAGGGAYHLGRALRHYLTPLTVEVAPDAEAANVLGGYTALNLQARRGG
jgi:hypothetical protein